ncbi:GNAT family N-acetyltransferase (plasmid) [Streptomyces sp. HUAS TT11]|uniref:GNAT family N-acetyltransferase n=1 Tax=Streptomyces sp. HUAS TT11 TaxID=3447508 RepID=UPI003F65A9C5
MTYVHDSLGQFTAAYVDLMEDLAKVTTGRARRGRHGALLAVPGAPAASLNFVISPSPEPLAEDIAALAESERWDVPWSIQVRGVPGPRVAEEAARHGLTRLEIIPLMVRRPEEGMPAQQTYGSLKVRAIEAAELGLYVKVMAEGFGVPHEVFAMLNDPAVARLDGVAFYLAEVDGVPVGTGMTAVRGELNGIFNISTLPGHRRRGYGWAVTMELVRAGYASGAPTAYLYASAMGEPVYASAGFHTEEYLSVLSAPTQESNVSPKRAGSLSASPKAVSRARKG